MGVLFMRSFRRATIAAMVYWVVVRSLTTGEIIARHSFRTHKEAILKKRELEECPDPEGHVCKVEIQMLWHPEYPR